MKITTVALLRSPLTHEPLNWLPEPGPSGSRQPVLVSTPSGKRFAIRDGIPLLLDEVKLASFNRRYQRFYNTIARCYDPAIKVLAYLTGGHKARARQEYLQAVEIQEGNRVLEVSIGTGANLRYLPVEAQYFRVNIFLGNVAAMPAESAEVGAGSGTAARQCGSPTPARSDLRYRFQWVASMSLMIGPRLSGK